MNNQFFLPMIVIALAVAVVASVATVALSEVFQEDTTLKATTANVAAGADDVTLQAMREEQQTLEERLAAMEALLRNANARVAQPAVETPTPAEADIEEEPLPEGDWAARMARVERGIAALEARLQGLSQDVTEYRQAEPERLQGFQQQQMDDFRRQAESGLRTFVERAQRRMMDNLSQQLDLDEWQSEAFTEEVQRGFQRTADVFQRLRNGEITQDQAREEMGQIRQDSDNEMRRILTQEQYDRLSEMQNGQQNPLNRFFPGGGAGESNNPDGFFPGGGQNGNPQQPSQPNGGTGF